MRDYYAYIIENAGGNRFNVVRREPTVIAKELKWEEAYSLASELNAQLYKLEKQE